jgi:hypothetical protein
MAFELGASYQVVSPHGAVDTVDRAALRDRIRRGEVTASTLIAPAGIEEWKPAADYPELQHYFELAAASPHPAAKRDDDAVDATVSPARLITYLALAGLTAGWMMMILAPICMIFGGFLHDVVDLGAFGAIFGLGINSALKESDPRMIYVPAAGFAIGCAVAEILPIRMGEFGFTGIHLGVIGLCGGIGLTYALRLTLPRALPMVIAATILFPVSLMLDPARHNIIFNLPAPLRVGCIGFVLVVTTVSVVRFLPIAVFGAILGATLAYGPGARQSSVTAR